MLNLAGKRVLGLSVRSLTHFAYDLNKFNDIHIKPSHLDAFNKATNFNPGEFEASLKDSVSKWSAENRSSVWLYIPIELSHLASISAKYGFKYHHAENDMAVLYKWLPPERESKVPMFASHQLGVAGVVYRPDTKQILMIKDKVMVRQVWKFPGGAANLGEDLEETAVREVFEETGVRAKFASVLGLRQSHNYPGGHGRSDMYICCRLEPITYEINACKEEISACEWLGLDEMCNYSESSLTQLIARTVRRGVEKGFDEVDIRPKRMESLYPGRFFKYFFRNLSE